MKGNCTLMDEQLFSLALDKVLHETKHQNGIGTLSEKTIHAVLKEYYSTYESQQEQKVNSYVADILIDSHIIEIQTRNFNTLRRKLDAFLSDYEVTIIYPVAHTKWLRWINEDTGEISAKRKSPKTGTKYQVFKELYKIKTYLNHPNLHLRIVLLDVEEYRLLNGWSEDKKKGSTRNDGIPVALYDEIKIERLNDYINLLPMDLPNTFTVADYKKSTKLSTKDAGTALNILKYLDIIKYVGKKGRAFLYERNISQ